MLSSHTHIGREARTVRGLLRSWLGGGKGICCSSSGFCLPLPPTKPEAKSSPSPQNGAHVPACLLPRQHRARGLSGSRLCASAMAASAARHAGSCSAGGRSTGTGRASPEGARAPTGELCPAGVSYPHGSAPSPWVRCPQSTGLHPHPRPAPTQRRFPERRSKPALCLTQGWSCL